MKDSVPLEGEPSSARVRGTDARRFDVFLSYNSGDKPLVERIAERLKRARVEPWLDAWCLVPGTDWQRGLADGLAASRSCAVFVGPADLGAWENQEVAVALDRAATDAEFRLFLVLLPGLPARFDAAALSPFLRMRAWVDYRRGLDDERAFQVLMSAVQGLPLGPEVPIELETELCPYRGLEVFEEEHTEFFFGRDPDVQRLLEKLKGRRFLAVLGASGSGKSSLVRAGLIPALERGALSADERWEVAILRPGPHPLEALAALLLRLGEDGAMQQTLDALASDPRTLHLAASLALPERQPSTRLLLVVDQFEEVFTLCRDEQERGAFFANLLYAATIPDGRSGVLLTMRADFYHRCGAYPELAQQLSAEQYLVSPMQPEGLRQAVEEPARRTGLAFEPGLVATILDDVADQPGALPLLEHALLEVWRRRSGGILSLAGYRESGGVQGAIAKRAEQVFESLEPDQQELARRTFLRLTQPGEGTEDTRRRARLSELEAGDADRNVDLVLAKLVEARLVTTSHEETAGGEIVEVAHEALIRGWPRLRAWIDEDRAGLRVHRRLISATQDWERLGRDESSLYRGARLAEAVEWRKPNEESLSALERGFLAASQKAEQDELEQARRRARRLRTLAVALAVLLAGAFGTAVYAKRQTDAARAQERIALSRQLAGEAVADDDHSPAVAMLLSLEAYRLVENASPRQAFEARSSMLTVLRRNAPLTAMVADTAMSVAFSPDERTLASAGGDGIRLWDLAKPALPPRRLKHGASVFTVVFSPDGRTLASAGEDGTRLWDLANLASRPRRLEHGYPVWSVAFSRRGRTLASAGDDGTVRIWNLANPALPVQRLEYGNRVWSVALSRDGRTLAAAGDTEHVKIWDLVNPASPSRRLKHSDRVWSVAFSPDGRTLASAGDDGTVKLWDIEDPTSPPRRLQHPDEVLGVVFSPDGRTLASASLDWTVRLWDLTNRASRPRRLEHNHSVLSVAFSRDGRTLASASRNGPVRLWDLADPASPAQRIEHSNGVSMVAFSPDGRTLASADSDGTSLWQVADPASPAQRIESGHRVSSVAFSRDGRMLASAGRDRTVRIWDLANPASPPRRLEHGGPAVSVAFSPDGRTLAMAGDDGIVRLRDLANPASPDRRLKHGVLLFTVAFSPDGRTLASADEDGTVKLWDLEDPTSPPRRLQHPDWVWGLAFSSDGRTLATASKDGTVRLWELANPAVPAERLEHGSPVADVAFSLDARTLVSAGFDDGTVRLWDTARRSPLGPDFSNEIPVESIALSPNGTLATVGQDGTVRLWQVLASTAFSAWQERLCAIARRNLTAAEWERLIPDQPYEKTCPQFR